MYFLTIFSYYPINCTQFCLKFAVNFSHNRRGLSIKSAYCLKFIVAQNRRHKILLGGKVLLVPRSDGTAPTVTNLSKKYKNNCSKYSNFASSSRLRQFYISQLGIFLVERNKISNSRPQIEYPNCVFGLTFFTGGLLSFFYTFLNLKRN